MLRVRIPSSTLLAASAVKTPIAISTSGRAEMRGSAALTQRYALGTSARAEMRGSAYSNVYRSLSTAARAEIIGSVALKPYPVLRVAANSEMGGSAALTERYALRSTANSEFRGSVATATVTKSNGIYGNGAYGYPPAYGNYNPVTITTRAVAEYRGTAVLRAAVPIRPVSARDEFSGATRFVVRKSITATGKSEFVGAAVLVRIEPASGYIGRAEMRGLVGLRATVPLRAKAVSEYRGTVLLPLPTFALRGQSEFRGAAQLGRVRVLQLQKVTFEYHASVGLSYGWSWSSVAQPDLWVDATATMDPWQTARPTPEV